MVWFLVIAFFTFLWTLSHCNTFSSYQCSGLPWYYKYLRPIPPEATTCDLSCMLHNVCYNSSDGTFIYYREPEMSSIPLLISGTGEELYAFPKNMFVANTWHRRQRKSWLHVRVQSRAMCRGCNQTMHTTTYVLDSLGMHYRNLGHWWWQYGLPMYRMFQVFAVQNANILTLEPIEDPKFSHSMYRNASWMSSLFQNPPATLNQFSILQQSELVCFKSLLVGRHCLDTYFFPMSRLPADLTHFHSHASNISAGQAHEAPSKPHISLVVKYGGRVPLNYGDVIKSIRFSFPTVGFTVLNMSDEMRRGKWTIPEQIKTCLKTTLLLTPTGGSSSIAIFLPRGATLMQFGFWDSTRNSSYDYDSTRYSEIPYIRMKTFPVLLNETDVKGPFINGMMCMRNPRNKTRQSSSKKNKKNVKSTRVADFQLRNFGMYSLCNYTLNIPRLLRMIAEDLNNWQNWQRAFYT